MNIDTSTISTSNEKSNYLTAMQGKLSTGNLSFKSQFNSVSNTSNSDTNVEKQSSKDSSEDKITSKSTSNTASSEEKKENTPVKTEENSKNTDQEPDKGMNNEDLSQNQQQNSNQNSNQNPQSENELLSEEIAQMIKINSSSRISDVANVQQNKFVTGISEDVYTSAPAIDYQKITMSDEDAAFFVNLVTQTDMSMQSIASEFQKALDASTVQNVQKTARVSSLLMEALTESMKTNKPFRIDFDENVSVIMRVDKNGSLSANFIPGDKAVEAYLRNNIPYLKQRFEEQNLSYNELTYSRHKKQEQEGEKRNNKEKDNE